MKSKKYTFWEFLSENKIEIPIIQRDYAQGREGKENLRKTILADLKHALDGTLPGVEKLLKLDFVYGSRENDKIQPLDGQQRLTTLWLLHWYVALMAGEMETSCGILSKFGYETRMSSREFCEQMCNVDNFRNYLGGSIVEHITSRTWFYSAWKQDPTIQSMLQMLQGTKLTDSNKKDIIDGIEERFKGVSQKQFHAYWEKLTDSDCPIIFYYQELEDFGLSDDLYIKMNARGKQLTSFENFKADLVGYIEQNVRNQAKTDKDKWNSLLDPVEGLPIKLDTKWMNLFWKKRSKGVVIDDKETHKQKVIKSHQIDEIYFAFLNRCFWNELFVAKFNGDYVLEIGKDKDSNVQENKNKSYYYFNDSANSNAKYEKISYEGLDVYKYFNGEITIDFFEKLKRIFDNYIRYKNSGAKIPKCKWNSEFSFIPKYIEENGFNVTGKNNSNDTILKVAPLTQIERIAFFALCKYFANDSGNEESLKKWMRVVWNIISAEAEDGRPQIRSTQAVRSAIEFIDTLDSHNIYASLNLLNPSDIGNGAIYNRCKEEIEKAKKIVSEPDFEEKIIKAENYASFKGSISFLFIDEAGKIDWKDFDTKYSYLTRLLNHDGLTEEYKKKSKAIKLLLSHCDCWAEQIESRTHNNHYIFGCSFNCWKNSILLRTNNEGIYLYAKPVHLLLTGNDELGKGPSDFDIYRKPAYLKLINTDIIDHIYDAKNSDKYYIRWIYNNLCLYPSSEGFVLSMPTRDRVIQSLVKDGVIELCNHQQMSADGIIWGWYVNFKYNDQCFVWCPDKYIYLTDENYNTIIRDEKQQTDTDKYYCYMPSDRDEPDLILNELTNLVKCITDRTKDL